MTVDNLDVLLRAREEELSAIYENVPGILFYIAVESDGEREAIRSGQTMRWEEESVYPAGRRYGEVAVTPLYDGGGVATHLIGIVHDITERKQIAEERAEGTRLRTSEERLRMAQQVARIGTFEWNIRTGVNTWTPELEALYGLSPGSSGKTQTAFENLLHPLDRARVIGLTDQTLETGQPTEGEWRIVWPDGSVHWIAGRWQVFMNEAGEPSRVIGVNIDITDRKLMEQELARANEQLRLAIEAGSVGGWDWNIKTDENVWFGKAHAQVGMTPDETLGSRQEFWDRVHKDDWERLQHAMLAAKEKHDSFNEDFRIVWRDGTIHWLRSRGQYYYGANGEPERMLGISVDITQSKQAEQMLRESEQRFRLATQAAKMYSFEWDVTTGVVERSSERAEILGDAEPLRSSHQQFVEKIHPEDRPRFLATIAKLTPEHPIGDVTYRVQKPDGSLVWLKSSGRAFFDNQRRMVRVIGMVTDVTTLKRAEEALSGMTQKLIESQEQERSRIARELHDEIDQRLALLAVTLDGLTQSPLASAPELRHKIKEASNQAGDLGSDIQAIAHQLHSSKLEYLGLASAAGSFCKEFAERHKTKIDFQSKNVPKDLPNELSLTLFRVLQEALQNAAKHSGSVNFQVSLTADSSGVELIVRDSGIGFHPAEATRGRGLGLTSIGERLKLVNGTLSIDSQPERGTTVHAGVPLPPRTKSADASG